MARTVTAEPKKPEGGEDGAGTMAPAAAGRKEKLSANKARAAAEDPGKGPGKAPGKARGKAAAKAEPKTVSAGLADKPARGAAAVSSDLRKKDLVARVVERTGAKKSLARDLVDAVLDEIGAALSKGAGLNLPPLGKAKVNRHKERGAAEVLVVKFRRGGKGGGAEGAEGLADAED